MQIINDPDLPVRDLEWYKKRYEGTREDVVTQTHQIESLELENKSLHKHLTHLEHQLDAAKDLIDELWHVLGELGGRTRIEHDE